jgi:DNA replication and repair protein RecF
MVLDNLLLFNFKNYKNSSFEFNARFNFIFGDNGNGKTNVLEAISMLCYTKSFLQSAENECVKYGEQDFEISGTFRNVSDTKNKVLFKFSNKDNKKVISLNNDVLSRYSSFFGSIPLVILSPGDIKLTQGSPADKRRNFDIIISLVSHLYFDELKDYTRIIKQKNSLLRNNLLFKRYSASELKNLIEPWNEELVDTGVKIILKREQFVKEFQQYIDINFKNIVGEKYIPVIEYECDITKEEDNLINKDALISLFRIKLDSSYNTEIKRGMSLAGPHRDNYVFRMQKNGNIFEMKAFASQGEHKTFLVALKLSEYSYLKEKIKDEYKGEPILLLDDLYSELDRHRKEKISKLLPQLNQVFLTTTDTAYLELLKNNFAENDISAFHIINGTQEKVH